MVNIIYFTLKPKKDQYGDTKASLVYAPNMKKMKIKEQFLIQDSNVSDSKTFKVETIIFNEKYKKYGSEVLLFR